MDSIWLNIQGAVTPAYEPILYEQVYRKQDYLDWFYGWHLINVNLAYDERISTSRPKHVNARTSPQSKAMSIFLKIT